MQDDKKQTAQGDSEPEHETREVRESQTTVVVASEKKGKSQTGDPEDAPNDWQLRPRDQWSAR